MTILAAALVSAIISLCAGAQCETHQLRLERKMCGQHSIAQVPSNGAWVDARASVTCTK